MFLDEVTRALLQLKLDAADTIVEPFLRKARRDFDALALTEKIDVDLSEFDWATRIIAEVILVGLVTVKYRALTSAMRVGHETHR